MFLRNLFLVFCLATLAVGAPVFAANAPPVLGGLISAPLPRFPPELVGIKAGDGEVVMAITLAADGTVEDGLALEATNEAFAKAATAAVMDWRFSPVTDSSDTDGSTADVVGSAWPRREVLQFSFKRSGVVTTLSHAEGAREQFIGTSVAKLRTVAVAQLDREPERIVSAMPKVSTAALAKRGDKPLMINFVIDREGKVRVPVVSAVDDPVLAKAVLAAVKQWRYIPPLQKGEPIAVEVNRALVLPELDPQ